MVLRVLMVAGLWTVAACAWFITWAMLMRKYYSGPIDFVPAVAMLFLGFFTVLAGAVLL